jgi:hypothetical protein
MVVPRAAGVAENDDYRRACGRRETPPQDTDLFGSLPKDLDLALDAWVGVMEAVMGQGSSVFIGEGD